MSSLSNIEKGSEVTFIGFTSEDLPDNHEYLEEGQVYPVHQVVTPENEEDEVSYILEVETENPEYDENKRKSKNNTPTTVLLVDVFGDEISTDAEGEEEEEEAPAPKATKKKVAKKKVAKKKAAPAQEEEEEESPAPANARKVAKKKVAKKKVAKKKTARGHDVGARSDAEDASNDKELKDMIILGEGEEDEDILALVEDTDDICGLAQEVANESAYTDYRLGGILYHVRLTKAYKELDERYAGVKGFEVYAEEMLSVGYRKAMYLIKIYTKWNKYGLSADSVAEIGWTKAQVIAQYMDEDNAEELVQLAHDENTVDSLKDTVKESYSSKGTGEVIKRITFKFRLVEDAAAAVSEYLELAAAEIGQDKLDDVFEHIVTEWAQEHLEVSKVRKASTKKAASGKDRAKGK